MDLRRQKQVMADRARGRRARLTTLRMKLAREEFIAKCAKCAKGAAA